MNPSSIGINMWEKFAFLFLFILTGFYAINTRYHHVNEVFNAINHDYLYHVTMLDMKDETVYFDQPRTHDMIRVHFNNNLKRVRYIYKLVFYKGSEPCSEDVQSNHFKINLQADLGFNAKYNKTFSYYLN